MEKRNSCLTIAQIRRHVNFGNNLQEAKQKKVGFYFVTLKWHRSTCYVNWAILIWDPVDVTTLLLYCHLRKSCISVAFAQHTFLCSYVLKLQKSQLFHSFYAELHKGFV